jgi:hypothetical protein
MHQWSSADVVLPLCIRNAYVNDLKQSQMYTECMSLVHVVHVDDKSGTRSVHYHKALSAVTQYFGQEPTHVHKH